MIVCGEPTSMYTAIEVAGYHFFSSRNLNVQIECADTINVALVLF